MQEKESPTNKSFGEKFQESFKEEMKKEKLVQKFQKWKKEITSFVMNLKNIRNVESNNYELGKKHYALGNFDDAVMRFKMVTWINPNNADGWYWLGKSYIAIGKKEQAQVALKTAMKLRPNWPEAAELLNVANNSASA